MRHPVDALGLSARTRNALVRAGVVTLDELMEASDEELLNLRGFGMGALSEVRAALAAWAQAHPAVAPSPPPVEAPPAPAAEYEEGLFLLLPGRRVLHAAWLPAPSHALLLWGEGEEREAGDIYPFCIPAPDLRGLLAGMLPADARETRVPAHLPTEGGVPQPSPQLIRDSWADERAPSPGEAPLALVEWQVEGLALPPLTAMIFLNTLPAPEEWPHRIAPGADLRFWSLAGKFALELLARQQFAPTLTRQNEAGKPVYHARWTPALNLRDDLQRVERLAQATPPVCRAFAADGRPHAPRALLKDFLGAVMDAAVRAWAPPLLRVVTQKDNPDLQVWLMALFSQDGRLPPGKSPQDLEKLRTDVAQWLEQIMAGAEEPFRICFRLEPPEGAAEGWMLRFFLQARDDPSLLVPADRVWRERGSTLRYLDRRFDNPQEKLLAGLGQAARLFPPLAASLRTTCPEGCALTTDQAYTFLREAAPLLEESSFGVLVPPWWKKRYKRLGLRAKIAPLIADGQSIMNLDALVKFRWEVALGEQTITPEEFRQLAALKRPLVQVRGEWVELQPEQVEAAIRFWEKRAAEEEMSLRHALQIGLAEEGEIGGVPIVGVETEGWVNDLLLRLRGNEPLVTLPQPRGLTGHLRPYQERGFSWLAFLRRWGLGACLADDMGLGKTIQAISLILHDLESGTSPATPVLVICPTSVVGNWARELARFAPGLRAMVHHGGDRAGGEEFVAQAQAAHVVISTYALARRDEETLRRVNWAGVVLDEAQNIKNPSTKQAQAIRGLSAGYRIALTGTPVENRLTELWSVMQFLNPGYLGSQQAFSAHFARPIERYQDEEAAVRLRRLVRPFILRRVKTDPTIIQDLPEKLENKIYCTLTPEQATLYQAVVEETLAQIEEAEGMQRRGLVLAMLLKLKQVCNHPAQFLGEPSPAPSSLAERSGKLARLGEMLEEVLAVDERALIFTQFAEMGKLLQAYLQDFLGGEALFLHGGTPVPQRERMIARFQEERRGPAVFILSLKAGGLGLNLTRANHVFHFDRWWNPAVENQATDRAFRIGQTRDVWVHKFLCAGTLEERIDELIESKKALAESVIGAGESWLTELDTAELRELVTLRNEAVGE